MYDNICAIATPYGVGAISIIRASGPNAIELINKIFKGKDLTKCKSHTMHYGYIMDEENIVDEVLANIFLAPKSFDGENCVEINCHGGILCTNKVLRTLLNNGFRMAEPGEFSKRAFLNKRMDLTQAEAIMDIISAQNNNALISGENSLRSQTKVLVSKFRDSILDLMAKIEVNIDYPEYEDAITVTNSYLMPKIEELISGMKKILINSEISKVAIHGINVAIVGKPNVGKSSILNMLLDEDKAIVSNIAGTTRDLVEGTINIGDVTIHLIDTAGIRDSSNEIEKIGIERTKKAISKAELVLLVLDQSLPLDENDYELLQLTDQKKRIIVANKCDLIKCTKFDFEVIELSAKDHIGMESLATKIKEVTRINEFNVMDQNYLSNVRHLTLLDSSMKSLEQSLLSCKNQMPVDLVETDLRGAFDDLGKITGESYQDEIIDSLFSKFCLGK